MLYKKALRIYNIIYKKLLQYKIKVYKVGSLRRELAEVHDIDFLIVSRNKNILKTIEFNNSIVRECGTKRKKIYLKKYHIKIDLFYSEPAALPFALLHHTGSKDFNIRIRSVAKKRGLKLNQYGLFKGTKSLKFRSERSILKYLNITYKSPKDRI